MRLVPHVHKIKKGDHVKYIGADVARQNIVGKVSDPNPQESPGYIRVKSFKKIEGDYGDETITDRWNVPPQDLAIVAYLSVASVLFFCGRFLI